MTTATIRTSAPRPATSSPRKLTLLSDTGARVVLPFAPVEGAIGGLAGRWEEVDRDGQRAPLLVLAGPQLKTLDLEATITDTRHPHASAEHYVTGIANLIAGARRIWLLNYGTVLAGPWQITDFGAAPFARQPDTNIITGFTATLALKASSDLVRPAPPAEVYLNLAAIIASEQDRTVLVRPGETPNAVARRALGSSARLGALLDVNGLRDPRQIVAGDVLLLP